MVVVDVATNLARRARHLHGLVAPGTYTGVFDHYSFPRTLEDGFRLSGYVGHAAQANSINNIWSEAVMRGRARA